jgi:hypothetical protein
MVDGLEHDSDSSDRTVLAAFGWSFPNRDLPVRPGHPRLAFALLPFVLRTRDGVNIAADEIHPIPSLFGSQAFTERCPDWPCEGRDAGETNLWPTEKLLPEHLLPQTDVSRQE